MSRLTIRPAVLALLLLALTASLAAAALSPTQKGDLRVTVKGKMTPQALPRTGTAPIAVSVGGAISTVDNAPLPQLKRLEIDINRHGRLDYQGLPVCSMNAIQPATTPKALAACRSSLVGQGTFRANVVLKGEPPYPSVGRLLVFNGLSECAASSSTAVASSGRLWSSRSRTQGARRALHASDRGRRAAPCHRRPELFGHIYTSQPFGSSFVLVFKIKSLRHGEFGTALVASLPQALGNWGYVTGIEMKLSRRYSYRGARHSFLSAGCPAPRGFPSVLFPLARTSFGFAGGTTLTSTLTRICKARG